MELDAVVFILFNEQQAVLAETRGPDKDNAGVVALPGGTRHVGEKREAALRRECQEELGITPTQYFRICSIRESPDKPMMLHYYVIKEYDGQIGPNEGQQLQWVPSVMYERRLDMDCDKVALAEYERIYP